MGSPTEPDLAGLADQPSPQIGAAELFLVPTLTLLTFRTLDVPLCITDARRALVQV